MNSVRACAYTGIFARMAWVFQGLLSTDAGLIADPNLLQVVSQIKSDYSESYSLERLNMINHNENWVSSEKDVRSAWAKLEVLIKELLNP